MNIFLGYLNWIFIIFSFFKNLLVQTLFSFNIPSINEKLVLVNSFLNNIITLQISLVKFLFIIVILVFAFCIVVLFSKESNGIKVYPFEVYSNPKEYNGKTISECLIFESQRIWQIYQNANQKFENNFFKKTPETYKISSSVEQLGKRNSSVLGQQGVESQIGVLVPESALPFKINFYSENIETIISNAGDISFAGVNLPLSGLLLILKQILIPQNSSQFITGNLQENDSRIRLIAMMGGQNKRTWEINDNKKKSNSEDIILYLTRDLAFRIIHDLLSEKYDKTEWPQTKTWEGFKHYTEAINSYVLFINTGKIEYIENARKNCIRCLNYEKDFLPLFNLFFFLGVEYYINKDYYLSEDILRQCIGHIPQEENIYNILCDILLRLDRDEEALEAAKKATKLNPYLSTSWVNKSLALAKLDRYEEALEALDEAIKIKIRDLEEMRQ
jgi:tetratricopeptide (TPR) repeat protein